MSFHDDITEAETAEPPSHSLASIVGLNDSQRLAAIEEIWVESTAGEHWIPLHMAIQSYELKVRARLKA